jgi:hypothetical protein
MPRQRPEKQQKPESAGGAFYPGKLPTPTTIQLTPLGMGILITAQARNKKSRGDVVDRLLRKHGKDLNFDDDPVVTR